MFTKLSERFLSKKSKRNYPITFLRKDPSFYAKDNVAIERRDFKNERERENFFKAVYYLRSHV